MPAYAGMTNRQPLKYGVLKGLYSATCANLPFFLKHQHYLIKISRCVNYFLKNG